MKILTFKENYNLSIGYKEYNWYVLEESPEKKIYDLSEEKNIKVFLRFFYLDPDFFIAVLNQELNQDAALALKYLPIKNSITFCINNEMFFWLNLSFKWLNYIEIDNNFIMLLKDMSINKKFPQNIRQEYLIWLKKNPTGSGLQ